MTSKPKLRIYYNPRCTKSRQALDLIRAAGIEPEIVEYLKDPPTAAELTRLFKLLNIEPQAAMRRGEELYKELHLDSRKLSRTEAIQILADNPRLLERPIVVKGDAAVIGRPPENVNALL